MTNHLVIVESPAKAKTIKRYLGKGFEVLASYGHVRDLRPKEGAVDPDNNFEMHYAPIEKSAKYVALIAKALKKADVLYLATDPDREGEAISWHVKELMAEKKNISLPGVEYKVITTGNEVAYVVTNARKEIYRQSIKEKPNTTFS